MSKILTFGIILLFISIILIFIGSLIQKSSNVKTAGGIFIGPIPLFGFGEKKMFYFLWILAVVVFILFYFILKN